MTALALEDFDPLPDSAPAGHAAGTDQLEAFEAGYREGWEDAVRDAVETRDRVRRSLAARLEDLAFTYEEARAGVASRLETVVSAIAET
ncbi:MAG: hypothetical protein ACU0BS_10720, partial [Hasllibacter sp.]